MSVMHYTRSAYATGLFNNHLSTWHCCFLKQIPILVAIPCTQTSLPLLP